MQINFLHRWQEALIRKALKSRRIIILSGPRQCGKTTLAQNLATEHTIYRTLDNLRYLEAAKADPHGFVQHGDEMMIIDEVQRVPELLLALKADVDINQRPGRFFITGSADIQSLPHVNESLAGRSKTIRLRPLAMGEIYGTSPHFLKQAFEETFTLYPLEYNKAAYVELALRGGYPEVLRLPEYHEQRDWYKDYIKALLSRDLKDITNIHRQDAMLKLLECLAAWSAKFIDISEISAGLSITRPTIESYLNALHALYLVERVHPWLKTDFERVGKKDKLFMSDTGLMASILKWHKDDLMFDGEKTGKLLETFVYTQLASLIEAGAGDYSLYHYRDRLQREIDFLIQNEHGDYLGIEVKAGTNISHDSFKHLKWFKTHMAKEHKFIGIVLYTGNEILRFGENMWAVPISALWG